LTTFYICSEYKIFEKFKATSLCTGRESVEVTDVALVSTEAVNHTCFRVSALKDVIVSIWTIINC